MMSEVCSVITIFASNDLIYLHIWTGLAKQCRQRTNYSFNQGLHHRWPSLRKHNCKNWTFSDKKNLIVFIFLLKTDCGYSLELPQWDSSYEYPQSMFLSRNKKNNVYPCNSSFTIYKGGYIGMFSWWFFHVSDASSISQIGIFMS